MKKNPPFKRFAAILCLGLAVYLAFCLAGGQSVEAADTAACAYAYSDWSSCVSGVQTRTVLSPVLNGCIAGPPVLEQKCVSAAVCTGYAYSDWSNCLSDGKQTRTVLSNIPAGCVSAASSPAPELEKTCSVCTYSCGEWSACTTAGIKTRTCESSPADCAPPVDASYIPVVRQTCTATQTACLFAYGDWSACGVDGKQTRSIIARYPDGCIDSTAPKLSQSCVAANAKAACVYSYGDWSACLASGVQTRDYAASPSGCIPDTANPPVVQQTCEPSSPCVYAYGEWGECRISGTQTRSYSASPFGCFAASQPEIERACAYGKTACLYAYSEWSACNSAFKRTRTVVSKTPDGCDESAAPVLEDACKPCAIKYGDWSACGSGGVQIRSYSLAPENCVLAETPIVRQDCIAESEPCVYTYSEWGACMEDGFKTRNVLSRTPAGCLEKTPALIRQECLYDHSAAKEEAVVKKEPAAPCVYEFSAWSDCAGGKQTRMIISKSPAGCAGEDEGVFSQSCKTPPVAKARPSDAPKPDPVSVLTAEEPAGNLNGKTSGEWQKYYFKSEICTDANKCAGPADPDNDGLSNNEEFRFGTDPNDSDTDSDGYVDGYEIATARDPLVKPAKDASDAVVFEDVRESGVAEGELLKVAGVKTVLQEDEHGAQAKSIKISGKALPNTYITVYIYSDPIVLTIKTDADGNWSYVLDKPIEQGTHEVYVAVLDNKGKVTAKSDPLMFIQTAEAASVLPAGSAAVEDKTAAPGKARLAESYFIFGAAGLGGLLLALAAIGMLKNRGAQK